jgi:hypothetical protein
MKDILSLSRKMIFTLIFILFFSCTINTTTVRINTNNPPLVDMRNVERITVIPFESMDNKILEKTVSDEIFQILTRTIRNSKKYTYVDYLSPRDYDNGDVYIKGNIITISVEAEHKMPETVSNEKTKISSSYVINIIFEYSYVRAIDDKVLATIRKDIETIETDTIKMNSILDVANAIVSGPAIIKIIKRLVSNELRYMVREIEPWSSNDVRYLQNSTNRYQEEKTAKEYIKKRNYSEALEVYKDLFERTGSITAAYNTAILMEVQKNYIEAFELLTTLINNMEDKNMKIPKFIETEISRLEKLITDSQYIEYFLDENQE